MHAHKNYQNKKGFTLIEIIVVVIIIMAIAAIAIPNYYMAIEKTYLTKAEKYLLDIYNAELRYALYHNDFTSGDISQLDIEETVPQEYTLVTPLTVIATHGPIFKMITIHRQKPAPDDYFLNLLSKGNFTCDSPGSKICRKLGF